MITPQKIKDKIKMKALELKDDPYFLEKFETMGRNFAIKHLK